MNIKEKNTSNKFLVAILAALVFLCVDQRLSIKHAQESHDKLYELIQNYVGHVQTVNLTAQESHNKLYELIQNYVGHVQAVNLTAEGRREAFAQLFADRVFKEASTRKEEELLKHGVDGINAYLALNGNNVVQGIKNFRLSNPLYLFQTEISKYISYPNNKK